MSSSVTEKDKDKKPPLTHAEAVELMKKSLVSVIARTEAQRLSEAIAADGSIAEVVDIPISQVICALCKVLTEQFVHCCL